MQTLEFNSTEAGLLEATFVAGDQNVIQYHVNPSPAKLVNVNILARIDDSMPWVRVKAIVGTPEDYIARIDIPAGVTVLVSTNAEQISAGVLTD